jgi:hypothetical protein
VGPAITDRTAWSDAAKIIAVYFCSRYVNTQSLRCLLLGRGFDRSENAIQKKIAGHIRRESMLGNPESVNKLIQISAGDAEVIANVSRMLQKLSPLIHENAYLR